jgi:type IV secretion system protein VirB2
VLAAAAEMKRRSRRPISVTFVSMMLAPAARASGSSIPWEAPLQSILQIC